MKVGFPFQSAVANRLRPAQARPANSSAPANPADLVSIRAVGPEDRQSLVTRTTLMRLSQLGLPALGMLVGGPAGLGAAVAVNAAAHYLTTPSVERDAVRSGVLALLSGISGLAAGAGPLAVVGAAAAGALWGRWTGQREAQDLKPSLEVNREAVTRAFVQRVEGASLPERSPRMSEVAWQKTCSRALVAAFDRSVEQLGLSGALALLHQVGKDLTTAPDQERMGKLVDLQPTGQQQLGNTQVNWGHLGDKSPAFASGNQVWLDQTAFEDKGPAATDLILGHEFSHIHHKDQAAGLAESVLFKALGQLGWPTKKTWTLDDLEQASARQSRANEERADAEGVQYALRKGHSAESVASAARQVFPGDWKPDEYSSHPANDARIESITWLARQGTSRQP